METANLHQFGLDRLTPEERLSVAEAIWDSVARDVETGALPEAQRLELERRLSESLAHPDLVTPWEAIFGRTLRRVRP